MKKNKYPYLSLTILSSATMLVLTTLTFVIGLNSGGTSFDEFKEYSYIEHVDKTSSMMFSEVEGAQLYEAESALLGGELTVTENIAASGDNCVDNMKRFSSISYSINSSYYGEALLKLNTRYINPTSNDVECSYLFTLTINGNEINSNEIIKHSYNDYDFSLNKVAVVPLKQGVNRIDITALDENVSIDFLSLTPKPERVGTPNVIGERSYSFLSKDMKQEFEIEKSDYFSPGHIVFDFEASSYSSVFLSNNHDTRTIHINSDETTSSELSLLYKTSSNSDKEAKIVLSINNEEQEFSLDKSSESYKLKTLGNIALNKGDNVISFRSSGVPIYLDKLSLNGNINHSSYRINERYEAEDALLSNPRMKEKVENASNHYTASYLENGESLEFNIVSSKEDEVKLGIALSYWNDETVSLSSLFKLEINNQEIDISKTSISKTGSYYDFIEMPISLLTLKEGNNYIKICSFKDAFNIDYIFTYRIDTVIDGKIECEHFALVNGSGIERNINASNEQDVGFNDGGTYLAMKFELEADAEYDCSIAIASPLSDYVLADSLFSIYVNNIKIDLSSLYIKPTNKWNVFAENILPRLSFKQGFNSLVIKSIGGNYNLDYVIFAPVTK